MSAITEKMYATQEYICPVIKNFRNAQGKTEKILWIDWFSPPPDDKKR